MKLFLCKMDDEKEHHPKTPSPCGGAVVPGSSAEEPGERLGGWGGWVHLCWNIITNNNLQF